MLSMIIMTMLATMNPATTAAMLISAERMERPRVDAALRVDLWAYHLKRLAKTVRPYSLFAVLTVQCQAMQTPGPQPIFGMLVLRIGLSEQGQLVAALKAWL
jgi:hypothetical protein